MATLTLRDLAQSTISAVGTIPNGVSAVAEGLESYATEWKKERELQVLKNRVRRATEIEIIKSKMDESGLTLNKISENEQWVKSMLK